ncbi:MAG TPA: cation-translocating P-type ATPase [Candidatus Ventrisoma faecale]|nr:cation-translocating P-type ATPase [Candidatus Ventrisoma faecale]
MRDSHNPEISHGAGLTQAEAEARRHTYGRNELEEPPRRSMAKRFIDQLCDSLIFVLLAAAVISVMLGEWGDAAVILAVVTLNGVVGVIQEGKAEKAVESLKQMTRLRAVVVRGGEQREIDAAGLVPGDLVILDAGRQVPADLRLIWSAGLKIEESSLTGESVPVEKDHTFSAGDRTSLGDRKHMAFMSTNVVSGRGRGVVIATGMDTEIGKIAGMLGGVPEEDTPLQRRLADLGKLLSILAILLCAALFVLAVCQGRNLPEMLITAISLAVAAVPEGLPAVVTIVLALSVTRMVKVHTIVRRLPSVETLGAVNIVCSDKTGTLTQNRMKVVRCYLGMEDITAGKLKNQPAGNEDRRAFFECLALCNDGEISGNHRLGDPTELTLLDLCLENGFDHGKLEKNHPRAGELGFDSARKMMTTYHRTPDGPVSYTKGAPDEVLKRCAYVLKKGKEVPMGNRERREILNAVERMSGEALRTLAAAMARDVSGPTEKQLTFIGLAGMADPVREEARQAVKKFKDASVKTVMITGDHANTALAVARELGIAKDPSQCMTGAQIDGMDDETFKRRISGITVFARVSPDHKVRIVQAFKSLGNIVAMTGDGVNDAPSLKAADIGVAMGLGGTDVAKQASDIILADDNFATIEKAIEEGRGIYENIKKSVLFLLSSNFGEIMTMFAAIACDIAAPLKASHILWINLITDSLPALALGVDENDMDDLMARPPRDEKESLFAHGGLRCTVFYGLLIGGVSLAAFLMAPFAALSESGREATWAALTESLGNPMILSRAQTYAFTVLGLSQLFHAVGMRNMRKSVFAMDHLSNKLMIAAFFAGVALQAAVTEIPFLVHAFQTVRLSAGEWGRLLLLAAAPLFAHEVICLLGVRRG